MIVSIEAIVGLGLHGLSNYFKILQVTAAAGVHYKVNTN